VDRSQLPLNALRAFEASARHLSFTAAAIELCVTQAAVSHHIKALEARLGAPLFRRLPRGLALTDEGEALAPSLRDAFDRLAAAVGRIEGGYHEVLTVGVVAAFATGWLLPRIAAFEALHPAVDLRLLTNNNRADLAGEGLDLAIRYGDGAWHGIEATPLVEAPLTPLCAPGVARRLQAPGSLRREVLLRSYRTEEWPRWLAEAKVDSPRIRGPMFDSSPAMAQAAANGAGVALLPAGMFEGEVAAERLVRPFALAVDCGRYWLTRLRSRGETPAMEAFRRWLIAEASV
jgi:LysR family transcriptional regulator of beta-lactamase